MDILFTKDKIESLARGLSVKYDKFLTNRQYRTRQFPDDKEYDRVQTRIFEDIKKEETTLLNLLKELMTEVFPDFELMAYDSRYIVYNVSRVKLGILLFKGMKKLQDVLDVEKFFKEKIEVEVMIQKFEDLPDDIQKNVFHS